MNPFAEVLNGTLYGVMSWDHDETYLGIAYTDHFNTPDLVKIYDPNNPGSSCGSNGRRQPV